MKNKIPSKKFIDLAELLAEIMVESPLVSIDTKIPRKVILKTAKALEQGYNNGDIKEDKQGRLYDVWMIDRYGGLIDKCLS